MDEHPKGDKAIASVHKPFSDLKESIRNGQLLLGYASEVGISVAPEVIQSIVEAKNACKDDTPPIDPVSLEKKFWKAMEILAKSVAPVTVKSLRASRDILDDTSISGFLKYLLMKVPRKISETNKAVRYFRRWSLSTLFILSFVQVYWVVGMSVTTEVSSIIERRNKAKDEKTKIEKEIATITSTIDSKNVDDDKKKELSSLASSKEQELLKLETNLDNDIIAIEANNIILNDWNKFWRISLNILKYFFSANIEPASTSINGASPNANISSTSKDEDSYMNLIISRTSANYALHTIQFYLLPILYGLLGAITYVLRTLSNQIKNLSYTSTSNIGYRLRMILGALAGLAIVWFIKPPEQPAEFKAFTTLSPFAISFLAGYGVELFFSAMDRIISAFTSTSVGK